jgi:hypothetical protein
VQALSRKTIPSAEKGILSEQEFKDKKAGLLRTSMDGKTSIASTAMDGKASLAAYPTIDDWVKADISRFWTYCPAPIDGLHRCALLTKLFDYVGLNGKHDKIWYKVRALDNELFKAQVTETQQILANVRVKYDTMVNTAFIQSIASMKECKQSFDVFLKTGTEVERQSPLSIWVLSVIEKAEDPRPEATATVEAKAPAPIR